MSGAGRQRLAYAGFLAGAFIIALTASWTQLGTQIDNYVYDWMFNLYRPEPWQTQSIVLAIDEPSLSAFGGRLGLRKALARGLERISAAHPRAVAVDVIVADTVDPESDGALEAAFRHTPNLILPCDLLRDASAWDDPLPRFRRWAAAVGHVHVELESAVGRAIPLEKAAGHDRRWALALEAFRVDRKAVIVESPHTLEVAGVTIPATRASSRLMRIRYVPPEMEPIPTVSLKQLEDHPELGQQFSGRVVFAGVTAQTEVRDRWLTPYSSMPMPGVEMHANTFETIAQNRFLTDAPTWSVVTFCLLLVAAAGSIFMWLSGWKANLVAAGVLGVAHLVPYFAFTYGTVFPFSPGVSTAWFSIVTAAAWQHFVVRGRLARSETERTRYQQAMHFVTHEMRTPLTAIQGSSELITRYSLTDEKRKQIALLINSESKRLGRMIEMFLNVERLSAGEMQLKRENFGLREVLETCVERARPLADRKQIQIVMEELPGEALAGDRELMEYAFYNLLTNAIKYSPSKTEVRVFGAREADRLRISVQDQGIGMDRREVRKIFQKFYRTRRAEQSGETGTGIGLSIVEQIVLQHGGKIEVASAPGKGSCFTLILPGAGATVPRPLAAN